jgi:hypothetical protein
VYFFLPSNPLEARRLNAREKYIIIQRKAADNTGVENKVFKPKQVKEAFLDAKTWLIWFAIIALQVRRPVEEMVPETVQLTYMNRFPMVVSRPSTLSSSLDSASVLCRLRSWLCRRVS